MQKRGYEYELCIAHFDEECSELRVQNISLSSHCGFSTSKGTSFCNLGFCNIRYKSSFKPKVASMKTLYH